MSLEAFRRDGYILLKGLLKDRPELLQVQKTIYGAVGWRAGKRMPSDRLSNDTALIKLFREDPRHVSFVYDLLRYSPALANLLNCEPLLTAVSTLFENEQEQIAINNLNLRVDLPGEDWTENLPWHQDWPYNNPLYSFGSSIASWVAVFDAPLETGPMVLKTGSHLVGEVEPERVPHKGNKKRQDQFVYQVSEALSTDARHSSVQPELEMGDVLLFDLCLIHRSGINSSNMIRWSAQARYHNAASGNFLKQYSLHAAE
jgi:hypothetical protein